VENLKSAAQQMLRRFKGVSYAFGLDVMPRAGELAQRLGREFILVKGRSCEDNGMLDALKHSFAAAGLSIVAECRGAAPNSPIEDVERVRDAIADSGASAVVGLGGGSLIDALKGSVTLAALGGTCQDYFGVGAVTQKLQETGKDLLPMMAVQTASGSSAHLTKYANLTNLRTMQKKLFIDMAIVPPAAVFDYSATLTMCPEFTKVGAFDGICHLLEVYFGTPTQSAQYTELARIALTGLELIVASLQGAVSQPDSRELRENIGLGTDLGGYAIMVGSTNGPHLNSFSLVDLMDHGKATAMLLPYYACFFAPAIREKLLEVGRIYRTYGYIDLDESLSRLPAQELGTKVAAGMARLADSVGFPTRLEQVQGFGDEHMERMLSAAKDPALASKLQAMPIPMTAKDVDRYMRPILEAARTGDISLIQPYAG